MPALCCMETWKSLLKKAIRCFDEVFLPLDREGKPCWGIAGAINVMMESRPKVGFATDSAKIVKLYGEDPGGALERYGGQQMEFRGTVVQCQKAYGSRADLWAVWVDAKDIDVVGYLPGAIYVGGEVTMQGTCAGLRSEARVAVELDPATVR